MPPLLICESSFPPFKNLPYAMIFWSRQNGYVQYSHWLKFKTKHNCQYSKAFYHIQSNYNNITFIIILPVILLQNTYLIIPDSSTKSKAYRFHTSLCSWLKHAFKRNWEPSTMGGYKMAALTVFQGSFMKKPLDSVTLIFETVVTARNLRDWKVFRQ
jgi:hypothetical protein